jgi:hypothetical protein
MTRVELNIRRLVVHGQDAFDAEDFSGALKREVGTRLGEGRRVSSHAEAQVNPTERQVRVSGGLASEAANSVAGRLFK